MIIHFRLHFLDCVFTGAGPDLEYRTSFIRPRNSATRLFHNAQVLIAAQITKLYKDDGERGERDKKSFSGKRCAKAWGLMDKCYHLDRARKVLPD